MSITKNGHVPRFDRTDYPRIPRKDEFIADCEKAFDRIEIGEASVGSILCFWLSERRRTYHFPQHLGFITKVEPTGKVYVIHAIHEYGGVKEHRCDHKWQARICAAFEVPEVEPPIGLRLDEVWETRAWQRQLAM